MNYENIDKLAKQLGGIFFVVTRLTKKIAGVIRDEERQSPIFEFNIGNPLGLHLLFECEKALSDQNIAYTMTDVFWLGEPVTRTGLQYLGSTYNDHATSAQATQQELIRRVNQTIDKWVEFLRNNKRVYMSASDRMNAFLDNTDFGIYVRERYPEYVTPSVPDLRPDEEKEKQP